MLPVERMTTLQIADVLAMHNIHPDKPINFHPKKKVKPSVSTVTS